MNTFIPDFKLVDIQSPVDLENLAFDCGQEIKTIADTMEKDIPEGDCSLAFRLQLRQMATQIVNRLKEMALTGFTAVNLRQVVTEGRIQLNSLQTDFRLKTEITRKKTDQVSSKLRDAKTHINKCEFSPENFTMPTLTSSTGKAEVSDSDELQCAVEGCLKNVAINKTSSLVKNTLGKPSALGFKVGTKLILGHAPDESENPTRDLIICTATSTGVSETISCILKRTPLGLTVSGINLAHDVASILEIPLKKIESNDKFKEFWNLSAGFSADTPNFEEGIAIAKGCLYAAKAPGALLRSVQCEVSSAIGVVADKVGLTEENIEKTVDLLKQHPELLNDTFY
jgi:hypothetical protein